MKQMWKIFIWTVLLLGGIICAQADDSGYFLSWQQKKQLTLLGRIQDSEGTWYDIWICPGYAPPARYSKDYFITSGNNFAEYVQIEKYQSLKTGSAACFNWALKECAMDFTLKGIPRAWGEHFTTASERTQKKVFGWWLSYPWAFIESTAETVVRGVLGPIGTVGGISAGLAIVPTYHALDSAIVGTWNLGVNAIALPAVGITWNTAIAPPLALIGQKPAPSRVDDFWVTIVESGRTPTDRPLTAKELDLLAQWGTLLLNELEPFAQQYIEIIRQENENYQEQLRAAKAIQTRRTQLQKDEAQKIRDLTTTNEWARTLTQQNPDLHYDDLWIQKLTKRLQQQGLSETEIKKTLQILRTHSNFPSPIAISPVRPKTDPVRRSVEIFDTLSDELLAPPPNHEPTPVD